MKHLFQFAVVFFLCLPAWGAWSKNVAAQIDFTGVTNANYSVVIEIRRDEGPTPYIWGSCAVSTSYSFVTNDVYQSVTCSGVISTGSGLQQYRATLWTEDGGGGLVTPLDRIETEWLTEAEANSIEYSSGLIVLRMMHPSYRTFAMLTDVQGRVLVPTNIYSMTISNETRYTWPTGLDHVAAANGDMPMYSSSAWGNLALGTERAALTVGTNLFYWRMPQTNVVGRTVSSFGVADMISRTNTAAQAITNCCRGDGIPWIQFGKSNETWAIFQGVMPAGLKTVYGQTYSNLLVRLLLAPDTAVGATNKNANFNAGLSNFRTSLDSEAFSLIGSDSIIFTTNTQAAWLTFNLNGQAIDAGDPYRLGVYRDITAVDDTVTNNVQLLAVELLVQ